MTGILDRMGNTWQFVAQWIALFLTMAALGGGLYVRIDDKIDAGKNELRDLRGEISQVKNLMSQRIDHVDKSMDSNFRLIQEHRMETKKEFDFRRDRSILMSDAMSSLNERITRIEQQCQMLQKDSKAIKPAERKKMRMVSRGQF